jgi:peptidoglycan/LPS O-acetylase OafA/YrhL
MVLFRDRGAHMTRYRRDIDGLRAFAILPVVFFHYGLKHPFNGGFVGVDVFFVISGFLITKHINDEMENRTFSVFDFYNRRIRRIFPALFFVLLFCFVCSLIIEIPPEARSTSHGILGATFFVSNIVFYKMSGYFDASSQDNPLLHTWSLSVEEQFYVVAPIIFFVIKRFYNEKLNLVLCTMLILSFFLCYYQVYHNSSSAFYLVQDRAWEILLGSVVAVGGIPRATDQRMIEALGAAGILLILGSVFILDTKSLFPGPGALAPCFGTALVLYSGGSGGGGTFVILWFQKRYLSLHFDLSVLFLTHFISGIGRFGSFFQNIICPMRCRHLCSS